MAKKVKKPRVARTRNHFTMTESEFFSFLRSRLRRLSMYWKPISECKKRSRRPYKGKNKLQKWEYQCNVCKGWFKDKQVSVDHIEAAGQLKSFNDLPGFCERLFCEVDMLQSLCENCHTEKTKKDKLNMIK